MSALAAIALLAAGVTPATIPAPVEVTAPGPQGPLAGTLLDPGKGAPVIVIIPGSGPTDRDGNSPMGLNASSYRLLSEALAARGVATVRIDKRGMFGSKAAIPDANAVTVADYAADAHGWATAMRQRTGARCVWLLGHSEGGLVALQAAQNQKDLCGIILVSAAGRPIGAVIREQLRANPANAPLLVPAMTALDELEAGRHIDPAPLPAPLQPLFAARVQGYMIDLLAHDPPRLAASVTVPMLIVQGDHDIQVSVADAEALAKAQPKARLVIVAGMNHPLKAVTSDDRAANLATYGDPSRPVVPALVDAVTGFVKR